MDGMYMVYGLKHQTAKSVDYRWKFQSLLARMWSTRGAIVLTKSITTNCPHMGLSIYLRTHVPTVGLSIYSSYMFIKENIMLNILTKTAKEIWRRSRKKNHSIGAEIRKRSFTGFFTVIAGKEKHQQQQQPQQQNIAEVFKKILNIFKTISY